MSSASQRLPWQQLEEESTLPGLGERVTHPGFEGVEFLHVRARSLINHVPNAGGLPFEYTINVYRGCTHACSYCLAGGTPVTMADGRTKPIAELEVGDEIYGTVRDGNRRRYVTTHVLDHWASRREAYRIVLEDGTELIASGDHRFLSSRGWKHVTGAAHGPDRGPHLTTDDELVAARGPGPAPDEELVGARGPGPLPDDDPQWPGRRAGAGTGGLPAGILHREGRPVRLRGGRRGQLRLVRDVDPATGGKRTGRPLDSDARLRVVAIEPLGRSTDMYDITTGTGDFIADGVVSHNCFARPTHRYLELDPAEEFASVIVVKTNAVERLRSELRRPSWGGDHIALGTNTDPYQRCEGRYRLTRGVVETLTEAGNPYSVLTKGTLVTRDIDVFADAQRRRRTPVNLSVPTLDEEVWRTTEPGTPNPHRRIEAVAELNDAGVPSGVMLAPVLPGISDSREQLAEAVTAAVEAGARFVHPIVLHLRNGMWEIFTDWLAGHRPDLLERYRELYGEGGGSAQRAYRRRVGRLVDELVEQAGGTRGGPPRMSQRRDSAAEAGREATVRQLRLVG